MPPPRPESRGWSFRRDALCRLNPEIAARPDLANEVLYRLRAILLSVNADGLVRANEEFTAWLRGERTLPFGPHGEHTPVRLLNFEPARNNRCLVATQLAFTAGAQSRRFALVLVIHGLPPAACQATPPTRPAGSMRADASPVHSGGVHLS